MAKQTVKIINRTVRPKNGVKPAHRSGYGKNGYARRRKKKC